MSRTIVFIHGAWMTPLCWEHFTEYFGQRGYTCQAPAWPHKHKPVEAQRSHPDAKLAGLGITEIVDHYANKIRHMSEPPILIGHSFGGLFVQLLLDRGLGAAGVAIDPAGPKGVIPFLYPTSVWASLWTVLTPFAWNRILRMSFGRFRYGFVNGLPEDQQRAAYERYVVPETGRIFVQAALAPLTKTLQVDYQNSSRAPLLLIAGSKDHLCPEAEIRSNYAKYNGSSAVTEFKTFESRTHWIIGQDGWEEVAEYVAGWVGRMAGEPTKVRKTQTQAGQKVH